MVTPSPHTPVYPDAERSGPTEDLHGVLVADPYRWLESADDPRTLTWQEAQDEMLAASRGTWSSRAAFAERVEALLGAGAISPPYHRNGRTFFTRREPGQQFAVLYVRDHDDAEPRVLFDPIAHDATGRTTLDSWQPSKEGDRLAIQLSEGGDEESHLYVMDVASASVIDGPIDRCRYSPVAWLPGGEQFYFVRRLDPSLVPDGEQAFHRRVYLHSVGTETATDALIFGAGMTMTNYYGVEVSRDGRWLQVSASEGTEPRNDLWVADLRGADPRFPAFRLVQADVDAQTGLTFGRDGRVYVFTDLDAPRGRLAAFDPTSVDAWTSSNWRDLIPEDAQAVLDGFAIVDGPQVDPPQLLVVRTRHGVSEVSVHDATDGTFMHSVPLPGAGTVAGPVERPDGGPIAWIVYTDHTTVPTVYAYDARTGALTVDATPPGAVAVPGVRSELVEFASIDGTIVRMFVITPADDHIGPRPTVLYGYGGFGISLTPAYSAAILAWVEAGGAWVVANLRGGGEEGEEWHRAGMLGSKQNVFDDFHAAAQALIDRGITTPAQLAVYGGSNGGLLVGAAITQRPDLFNAAVCVAPLLDMIRYTTSQLGPTWTVEYGDPQVPEQFAWLHAYSPYHRVQHGVDYPATMISIFRNDTRTDPMHGRKMAAALQHATSGTRPILLRAEGDVGHGARSLARSVEESADTLAFLATWTGLTRT